MHDLLQRFLVNFAEYRVHNSADSPTFHGYINVSVCPVPRAIKADRW